MEKELAHDYEQYLKFKNDKPLFHRIKFDETSIYLTKSTYYDIALGSGAMGHYRVFSWADNRAKAFLGFELGQKSPNLGKAQLIGSFTPKSDDLTQVRYHTLDGKSYFESAKEILSTENTREKKVFSKTSTTRKIDAINFMKMKEIIPTGRQGKAIYGDGNYIIDGPAGSGKSTTVLQKIKLLQLHQNIKSDQICIIVKHSQVIDSFTNLLKNIDIKGICIYSQDEFLEEFYPNIDKSLLIKELMGICCSINTIIDDFKKCTDIDYLTALPNGNFTNLPKINGTVEFVNALTKFIKECKNFHETKKNNSKNIHIQRQQLSKKLVKFEKLTKLAFENKDKKRKRRQGVESSIVKLSLPDETEIRDIVSKEKKKQLLFIKNIISKNKTKEDEVKSKLINQKLSLIDHFLQNSNLKISFNGVTDFDLLKLYVNKNFDIKSKFHTLIIDEAQDVAAKTIELVRLQSQNTILVGDESQHESATGIGYWKNVPFLKEEFFKDNKLNIYKLRHNFRQTYELGVVSYNYRQLLLELEIEDIKQDYFDDQVGFYRPTLQKIDQPEDFLKLVEKKIIFIKNTFTEVFPLVIFYKTQRQSNEISRVLSTKYTLTMSNNLSHDTDIVLISVDEIAGREFPVVIAPLMKKAEYNTTYVILSRATIDLTLIYFPQALIDKHIQTICSRGLISM